ncbi:MAG TPA: carbonic anhydrase, partial [Bryobacteraceae bacterium]|nr:carbonic anhydrase [Bryobacteraceae bacterium]
MKRLLDGYAKFHREVFPQWKDRFHLLAEMQKPDVLFITCADSRVVPTMICQTEPGDMFLCRTVGNVVPPHGYLPGGVSSTVEYAVEVLHVRDIIVCGHS